MAVRDDARPAVAISARFSYYPTMMRKDIQIPEIISSRSEYKKKFSFLEMLRAFVRIPGAAARMIGNNRKKLLRRDFIERLQLAVTEVNGCAACSYVHAYLALKQGMSNREIQSFLSADGDFVKQEEARAIVFAQHFADTRGFPKKDAYDAILDEYGEEKARIILSAAQVMIAGNIYGLPYSAFRSRLKGKPYKNSSLVYESGMLIAGFIFLPLALIFGFVRTALGFANIKFDESTADGFRMPESSV